MSTPGAESGQPLAGRRVLLVEDRYWLAEELRRLVEQLGGEVVGPVGTVAGALALIAAELPDLALLDIKLDGSAVYPVAETLRARQAPFIFTTGYEPWMVDDQFSAAPTLGKPTDLAALAAAVRQLGV